AWWQAKAGWVSGRLPVRSEKLYLIPGESPIGLRLPLAALPASYSANAPFYTAPADPFSQRSPLPTMPRGNEPAVRQTGATENAGEAAGVINEQELDEGKPDDLESETEIVGTAICVECRFGRLHIFMPPTQRLEDYLDLVSAIEATCEALKVPVVLEGYLPPPDDRVEYFKVTPDPGVIEVNTQPTATWKDLVIQTESLYHDARMSRLGAEKFDLDGRHTGTGGGSHVVLGGASPSESPFIRRPDLLASIIRFWHNHPSLSFMFSSRFIGPTSQAPRMDESRRDAVYEMGIAMSQLDKIGDNQPPWLVDRLFRDLLTDLTGNTHRAEICVDKLYSPDSSTGRLGLVEFRGFEMPPNSRMNLAQQLLIRAAVAVFWKKPYREPLANWGTSLYDRYMLPHFIWQDLCNLIGDLNREGVELESSWFAPHHEFRFQKLGEVSMKDVKLQLRNAIEPWYVMGEEPSAGGTARYVDSSLERLEVLIDGFDPTKMAVLCNGVSIPMHPTGTQSQAVAGVKYRAWQPPRCLHPTIGIHTPLQFDVVERSSGMSIGGCRYHAVHPGGLSHAAFPINANEAESRRASRFQAGTMTGGVIEVPESTIPTGSTEYAVTLDMRTAY
ncbi:MAG: transglutaminase family protein, partial [Rubripirellula sp.]